MRRILKNYLFWTYPRGSFHYDVMVTLILAFLFLSPRLINYRDRPQETLTSTRDILVRVNGPNAWTYQIGADQLSDTSSDSQTAGGIAAAHSSHLRQCADRPLSRGEGCERSGDAVSRVGASVETVDRNLRFGKYRKPGAPPRRPTAGKEIHA